MLPTPDLTHLGRSDYDKVYEPAEDSFLFLDAIEQEADLLKSQRPTICLEIGSGSGVVSTFLASVLGTTAIYLCTDINEVASQVSNTTGNTNNVDLNLITTNLVDGLLPRLEGHVDVLLFNPPYVVTPSAEVGSQGIEASWAGGERGREVIDKVLPLVPKLLSKNGFFYLVIIKENDEDELKQIMFDYNLKMSTILSRRSGPERLSVLRFCS